MSDPWEQANADPCTRCGHPILGHAYDDTTNEDLCTVCGCRRGYIDEAESLAEEGAVPDDAEGGQEARP